MRIYKYVCDNCRKTLSDKVEGVAIRHIVLNLKEWGWIEEKADIWKYKNKLKPTVLHFCNPDCVKDYFMKKKFEEFVK